MATKADPGAAKTSVNTEKHQVDILTAAVSRKSVPVDVIPES